MENFILYVKLCLQTNFKVTTVSKLFENKYSNQFLRLQINFKRRFYLSNLNLVSTTFSILFS